MSTLHDAHGLSSAQLEMSHNFPVLLWRHIDYLFHVAFYQMVQSLHSAHMFVSACIVHNKASSLYDFLIFLSL